MTAVLKEAAQAVDAKWQLRPLAEVADILDSKRIPINAKERATRQGSVPYYGATGQVGWIDDFIFDDELVLLGEDGAPFLEPSKHKAYVVRGKSWVNNHAHVLRAREVPTGWLAHYLNSISYEGLVSGTTRLKLTQAAMRQINVPVAPSEIMNGVVAEIEKQFSRLDEAGANLKRIKTNFKRYKAAVLTTAVEGRLVPSEAEVARRDGRSYQTGAQLVQQIVEARRRQWRSRGKYEESIAPETIDLPELPEGWVWGSCDQVLASIDAGASFKCVERPPVDGEIGVLKVSAVTWGAFDESESKTCTDTARIEEDYFVQAGDFLFSRANTIDLVGACVIVGSVSKRLMLSDKTLRLRLIEPLSEGWLLACLRSKFGRREIERLATGNQESMRNIGQERIRQIRLPIPPLAEQHRIVAEIDRRMSLVSEIAAQVEVNLQRVNRMRQRMLGVVFDGSAAR